MAHSLWACNTKVPHYMVVSEAIGTGKVAVAHFRYSDLYVFVAFFWSTDYDG